MSERDFDPSKHLRKVSGADYLEVKWRLVWFRTNHPNGMIDTELVYRDDKQAVFKATVEIPLSGGDGGGRATGYGSETQGDFRDFLEKAETKAIGRALAALGFGTQFSFDHEDGAAKDRPVDAPVQRQDAPERKRGTSVNTVRDASGSPRTNETPAKVSEHPTADGRATQVQIDAINGIAQRRGITPSALDGMAKVAYRVNVAQLSQRDAAHFIEQLQTTIAPAQQAEMMPDVAAKARA